MRGGVRARAGGPIGYGAVRRVAPEGRHGYGRTLAARLPADWTTRRMVVAAASGTVAGALTTWPVAAVLTTVAVLTLPGLLGPDRVAERRTERMQALATWTEMLRDTLSAAAGLRTCPSSAGSCGPAGPQPRPRLRRRSAPGPGGTIADNTCFHTRTAALYLRGLVILGLARTHRHP